MLEDVPSQYVPRAAADIADMRAAAGLFAAVWGRNEEGVPIGSEMLRSLAHADGLVSLLHEHHSGTLLGAAALGRAEPGAAYSYVAATAPGHEQHGLGVLLKHHQRDWCLERDIAEVRWTFDPLVGRNARFNLTKLGAVVDHYEPEFYGVMSDLLNGTDPADRFVVRWLLDRAPRPEPPDPPSAGRMIDGDAETGPDGAVALVRAGAARWIRVPADIVALRRTDPAQASAWRARTRDWFTDALDSGLTGVGVTRSGWYHFVMEENR